MKLVAMNVDITTLEVDAIVNAANNAMIVGGGVDRAIHKAAGYSLRKYNALHHCVGCPTGLARLTPGFNLPAKYIIHTVGPDMRLYYPELGSLLLASCYRECMEMALDESFRSIAFPSISTGVYLFDKEEAAKIAVSVVNGFKDTVEELAGFDIDITFACFGDEDTAILQRAIDELT